MSDKLYQILALECRQCKDTIELESYFKRGCECGDLMVDRSEDGLEIHARSGQLLTFFYLTKKL